VALEKALLSRAGKKGLSEDDRDRLAVALLGHRARYEQGARAGQEPALAKVRRDMRSDDWHRVAQGKGVLLLHALRERLGAAAFDQVMDELGTANAGKAVTTAQLVALAEKSAGKSLETFFEEWLEKPGLPGGAQGGPFTVASFDSDIERTLIIYGTKDEAAANREAAEVLRKALLRRGSNVDVPVWSDREVPEKDLAGHHLLLVGRPATNALCARFSDRLPVKFGAGSAVVRDKVYAHPDTALLVAAESPLDRRRSVVVVAGLGAASTYAAASRFSGRGVPAGEVVILRRGRAPHGLVVPAKDMAKKGK
jgi:hypothetical protein